MTHQQTRPSYPMPESGKFYSIESNATALVIDSSHETVRIKEYDKTKQTFNEKRITLKEFYSRNPKRV